MLTLEKNKFALSFVILLFATLSVFYPSATLLSLAVIVFFIVSFRFPVFGILAAILASIFGEFGRLELIGISMLALDLVAPAVLAVWLLRKLILKEKIILDGVSGSLLVFWVIGALSLIFGSFELAGEELRFSLLHFFRFVGISGMLLVARDLVKKESLRVSNALIFGGILLAVSGFFLMQILPDFTEAGLADLGWDPHVGRLTSTFLDPNFAGGVFAFLIAILGGRFLNEKRFNKQILFLIIMATLGTALLLTFSRSALLALGVSGLVLGFLKDRRILILMLLIGILGVSVSPRLAERAGELSKSVSSIGAESQQVLDPTAQLRVNSWQEGIRIWKEHPTLGTGFGAYKFHQTFSSEDSHAATGSDASLLNIGATTGLLGLLAFGVFLVNLIMAAWKNHELGFLAAIAGILVHSIFVNSLFFTPLALYFFLSGGLANKTR